MFSVSVIIPVYNSAATIIRATESVLSNKCVQEIILVEDGSTDSSLEKCKDLTSNNNLIKLLRHPDGINKGANASRNLGVLKACGDWVQFLDADDELIEGKIDHQIDLVKQNPSCDLIIGNYKFIKENEEIEAKANKTPWLGLIDSNLGITSANLWKREALVRVKGWDTDLSSSQEYDLLFRLLQDSSNIVYDDAFLTKVYLTEESISRSPKRTIENTINRLDLRLKIMEYLKQNNRLSLLSLIYIHGFIGRNLMYLEPKLRDKYKINPIYFAFYRGIVKIKKWF